MVTKSTIFKANLVIADIDHTYYANHALTLARHPSETDDRMMVRLCALALHAHQLQTDCAGDGTLAFGAGLSNPDEPDVWLRDFTGQIRLWIEVGQPEDKPLGKACSKADAVALYCFGPSADVWWRGIQGKLARFHNLYVWNIPNTTLQALLPLTQRSMNLNVTVQQGVMMMSDNSLHIDVEPICWKCAGNVLEIKRHPTDALLRNRSQSVDSKKPWNFGLTA